MADRGVCVYTRSNTNRRCRLDKEIKGKGATQISRERCANGPMHLSLSLPDFYSLKLLLAVIYRKKIRERERGESQGIAAEASLGYSGVAT